MLFVIVMVEIMREKKTKNWKNNKNIHTENERGRGKEGDDIKRDKERQREAAQKSYHIHTYL